jgi:hypothetical protein
MSRRDEEKGGGGIAAAQALHSKRTHLDRLDDVVAEVAARLATLDALVAAPGEGVVQDVARLMSLGEK